MPSTKTLSPTPKTLVLNPNTGVTNVHVAIPAWEVTIVSTDIPFELFTVNNCNGVAGSPFGLFTISTLLILDPLRDAFKT